jgi:hypothetical protein
MTFTELRAAAPLLPLALLLLAGGCSSLSPTAADPAGASDDPAGRYALVAVNDTVLPYSFHRVVVDADGREELGEIVAGELVLRSDGSYRREIVIRWTLGGRVREQNAYVDAGGYVVSGDAIVISPSGGEPLSGRRSVGEIRIDFQTNGTGGAPTLTYVFRRL